MRTLLLPLVVNPIAVNNISYHIISYRIFFLAVCPFSLSGYLRRSNKKLIHLRVIVWASAENLDAPKVGVVGELEHVVHLAYFRQGHNLLSNIMVANTS